MVILNRRAFSSSSVTPLLAAAVVAAGELPLRAYLGVSVSLVALLPVAFTAVGDIDDEEEEEEETGEATCGE